MTQKEIAIKAMKERYKTDLGYIEYEKSKEELKQQVEELKLRIQELEQQNAYECGCVTNLQVENEVLKRDITNLERTLEECNEERLFVQRLEYEEYESGKKYQHIVNECIKRDWTMPAKFYMVYELTSMFHIQFDDVLIDKLFNAYIKSNNFNNINSFVSAIYRWCCNNETDLDLVVDYDKMLREL